MPTSVEVFGARYKAVAAGQTASALGPDGGKIGAVLEGILVGPASTSPGVVQIKDGAGTAITVFAGGAGSVSNLVSFPLPLGGIKSEAGAWQITTGANVSVVAYGRFT